MLFNMYFSLSITAWVDDSHSLQPQVKLKKFFKVISLPVYGMGLLESTGFWLRFDGCSTRSISVTANRCSCSKSLARVKCCLEE